MNFNFNKINIWVVLMAIVVLMLAQTIDAGQWCADVGGICRYYSNYRCSPEEYGPHLDYHCPNGGYCCF